MSDDQRIVDFPRSEVSEEEKARRLAVEVDRLAGQSTAEWRYACNHRAAQFGVTPDFLGRLVADRVREIEKAKSKAEYLKIREEFRERNEARKREREQQSYEVREQREETRKLERDQKDTERKAKDKAKDKAKAFADIIELPSDRHEVELDKLAKRFDKDPAAMREEFVEYCSTEVPSGSIAESDIEPWSEPVATAALLEDLVVRINQHVKAKPHEVLAIALWVLMAWVHEEAAHYSVYLVATAPKEDCGKTTLIIEVVGRLTPKSCASGSDPTVASIFRTADREKPTMLFDNVDTLFQRKPEVTELFLNGWTRGIKYQRTERIGGHWQTVWYDPFCPKACSLIGTNMPRPLLGRCLLIELWPPKPGDQVVEVKPFDQDLMDAFETLRRKALRWSNDNAPPLKNAEPLFPAGFATRPRANARLLLAIAELGGAGWAEQARAALDKLLREKREPGWLELLLQELWAIFVTEKRKDILSKQLLARLTNDPTSEWCEFSRGHKVTERQVAYLLRKLLHIHPCLIGKNRLSGYRAADLFEKEIFQHFLGRDPLIVSPDTKKSRPHPKKKRSRRKARR